MPDRKTQMNIPGLSKLKSIGANKQDLKDKVNDKNRERTRLKSMLSSNLEEINDILLEIEKIEKRELSEINPQ